MTKRILWALLATLIPLQAFAADLRDLSWEGNFHLLNEGGTVAQNTFTIDGPASGSDAYAMLYQMPRADTITQICVRYGTAGGTPVAHQVSLQTPSATTFGPNGTILGASNNGKAAFTPTAGNDNTAGCFTLTAAVTVTQGQLVAAVVESTGTPAAGTAQESFKISMNNMQGREVWPVMVTKTNAGAWTRVDGLPLIWLKSASTTYGYPILNYQETTVGGSGSSPNEYGNAITLSSSYCSTFKVLGVTCMLTQGPAANTLLSANFYQGTTKLAHRTMDSDEMGIANDGYRTYRILFDTADSGTLADARTCGTKYYYSLSVDSVTENTAFANFQVNAAGEMDAFINGQNEFMATRAGGAWTETTTKRLLCSPIIHDITAPSAGGVIGTPGNTNGGMQ